MCVCVCVFEGVRAHGVLCIARETGVAHYVWLRRALCTADEMLSRVGSPK